MKQLLKCIILFATLIGSQCIEAQNKPASPAATAKGNINGASIEIKYSSPSVKGRTIWGELVPFDAIWRAGANAATVIETSKDLTIEGSKLPAGKYSFFVIPNKQKSILIFNKIFEQSGTHNYSEKEDQLRISISPKQDNKFTEALTYSIDKNSIKLDWAKWRFEFSVK